MSSMPSHPAPGRIDVDDVVGEEVGQVEPGGVAVLDALPHRDVGVDGGAHLFVRMSHGVSPSDDRRG